VNDGAVSVKLGCCVARIVGELLDQILVGITEFILRYVGNG